MIKVIKFFIHAETLSFHAKSLVLPGPVYFMVLRHWSAVSNFILVSFQFILFLFLQNPGIGLQKHWQVYLTKGVFPFTG